eukprot:6177520-Pleurochrysis_carterae.AAC.1
MSREIKEQATHATRHDMRMALQLRTEGADTAHAQVRALIRHALGSGTRGASARIRARECACARA